MRNKRKVTYHIFRFYQRNTDNNFEDFDFDDFVNYLNGLNENEKKYYINESKFCSVEFISTLHQRNFQGRQKCFFGCIKSAPFGTRKNLLDHTTNSERNNPKLLTEGEKEQNYFILAFNRNSEFEIIYQNVHLGINAHQFKDYLDKMIYKYMLSLNVEQSFDTEIGDIIINNPEEIIDRIHRIVECKVYMDKEVLGSEFLNLSQRTLNVKNELIIGAKAEFNQSIREYVRDVLQNLTQDTRIFRIWVRGKDNNNNETKFFIEKIIKSNYIEVTIDPNSGAIVRDDIKREMINLI